MQPITYSLILNAAALAICGFLALVFNQPLLIVVALVLQTHALERFQAAQQQDDEEDFPPQAMGFTADVK